MKAAILDETTGPNPSGEGPNVGAVAADSRTVRTLLVARGTADDLGTIVLQEDLTLSALADLFRQAQGKKVSYTIEQLSEARAAAGSAKKALEDVKAGGAHGSVEPSRRALAAAKARIDRMKRTPWITYAAFSGLRRRQEDIQSCTAFVGDADKGAKLAPLLASLDSIGCSYVVHTSTSHGCETEERYRVIIPLKEPLVTPREHYAALWEWFNDKLGDILDPGAKDPTRLNYMPRVPIGALGHQVICVDDRPWFDASIIPAPDDYVVLAEPQSPATTLNAEQEADLKSALQFPKMLERMSDNAFWSNDVGYALLSLGGKGLELFVWISRLAPNYELGAPETWWDQHKHYSPKMDFRHIYKTAGELGWENPRVNQVADPRAFLAIAGAPDDRNLQRAESGKPLSNVYNATVALSKQAEFVLTFDEFLDRVIVTWPFEVPRPLKEEDVTRVQIGLQRGGMTSMSMEAARQAINLVARRKPSNCVTAALDQLKWDGNRRLSLLLPLGFGTQSTRYHLRAGRNMLLAMVARAYEPGCQVDEALVFEGRQGAHKSSALRIIGGAYFKELTADPNSKDFEHQLRGVWLGEFPELHAMRRTDDIARIKQFITCREDHYRPPYGRDMHDYKRRVVLCGTTNEECWIHDPTGGRRFIPIEVGDINLTWLRENRDQLFAEAVVLYKARRKWWVYPRAEMIARQEARTPEDPWLPKIRSYLYGRAEVEAADVLEHVLRVDLERQNPSQLTRVGIILRKLGCMRQARRRIKGERRTLWTVPPELAERECVWLGPVEMFAAAAKSPPAIPASIRDLL